MMRKTLASVILSVSLLGGVTACNSNGTTSGYVDEVQYGYYDSYHHYHYYLHPHQVHISRSQYLKYKYEYEPHGTQHRVTIHKTTTTTTTRRSLTGRKTTTTTTTTRRTVRIRRR